MRPSAHWTATRATSRPSIMECNTRSLVGHYCLSPGRTGGSLHRLTWPGPRLARLDSPNPPSLHARVPCVIGSYHQRVRSGSPI